VKLSEIVFGGPDTVEVLQTIEDITIMLYSL